MTPSLWRAKSDGHCPDLPFSSARLSTPFAPGATAKEGQSGPWGRRVLLIALTGWGQREDIERAQSAGFDRHFTKPIDAVEIERLLATARRQDELVGT